MGGVVDRPRRRDAVAGLYAVGESACTGLHGANRLASNSLCECFVFGARAALAALAEPRGERRGEAPSAADRCRTASPDARAALWRDAGLERDAAGLERLPATRTRSRASSRASALARTESRGAHRRRDFPDRDPALDEHHTVIAGRREQPGFERWA